MAWQLWNYIFGCFFLRNYGSSSFYGSVSISLRDRVLAVGENVRCSTSYSFCWLVVTFVGKKRDFFRKNIFHLTFHGIELFSLLPCGCQLLLLLLLFLFVKETFIHENRIRNPQIRKGRKFKIAVQLLCNADMVNPFEVTAFQPKRGYKSHPTIGHLTLEFLSYQQQTTIKAQSHQVGSANFFAIKCTK